MTTRYTRFYRNKAGNKRIPSGYNLPQKSQLGKIEIVPWTNSFPGNNSTEYWTWIGNTLDNNTYDHRNIYLLCACIRCLALGGLGYNYWNIISNNLKSGDEFEYIDPEPPFNIQSAIDKEFILHDPYTQEHWTSVDNCLRIPLFLGEEVYKVPIFYGHGAPELLFVRKRCWDLCLYPMIEENEEYNRLVNHSARKPREQSIQLSDEDKQLRHKIIMKLNNRNKRYELARERNDDDKADYYVVKMKKDIAELTSLGGVPDQWLWLLGEEEEIEREELETILWGTLDTEEITHEGDDA